MYHVCNALKAWPKACTGGYKRVIRMDGRGMDGWMHGGLEGSSAPL